MLPIVAILLVLLAN